MSARSESSDEPLLPSFKNRPAFLSRLRSAVWRVYCFFSFSHVYPLLDQGAAKTLTELSAKEFHPSDCNPRDLLCTFSRIYTHLKDGGAGDSLDVGRALIKQEWLNMAKHLFSVSVSSAMRFGISFLLRAFLIWLQEYRDGEAGYSEGWLRGLLLVSSAVLFSFVHHPPFWIGGMMGYRMRTTLTAATHAKFLRLNASRITKASTGHIITLVSNDIQRLDMLLVFWPYLIFGPLEAILVTVFVAWVLGPAPAFAGMGCSLLIIPIQAILSKYVARITLKTTSITDRRVSLMSELISGSLAVKMLGWEEPWMKVINSVRSDEHRLLTAKNTFAAANRACPTLSLILGTGAVFITYHFTYGEFRMSDVFFALSLMSVPSLSLAEFFVGAVRFGSEALVAVRRLDAFLNTHEPPPRKQAGWDMSTGRIEMKEGNYGWYAKASEERPDGSGSLVETPENGSHERDLALVQTLSNINLDIQPGELVGIVGKVGSGKSSLLRALLGDMENLSSNENSWMAGSVSYCSQIPWIMAGSVRENVLFGQVHEKELYDQVIFSCALDVDLEQFPDGDNTEIGERGINLSGGQKARLALARAAYLQTDIALLDDPLSAVDSRVGRILFDKCIGPNGLMQNSTRLLVTHQLQFLPTCDKIIIMNDGKIEAVGTWSELSEHEIIQSTEKETSHTHQSGHHHAIDELMPVSQHLQDQESENASSFGDDDRSDELGQSHAQLVERERKEIGRVAAKVYWEYIQHIGLASVFTVVSLGIIAIASIFVSEWWVALWGSQDAQEQDDLKYVWSLAAITAAGMVMIVTSQFLVFALIVRGSTQMHGEMVERVLRAPLKFFHTNPVGRILNRFSKDMGVQDEHLPFITAEVLENSMIVVGIFVMVTIALPYMVVGIAVIFCFFWRVYVRYVVTSREVKRFDAITRSPVYATLSANLKGLPTIRAYRREEEFQEQFVEVLDLNGTWWTAFLQIGRWVGFEMEIIGSLVMLFAVVLTLAISRQVAPEILGLALTFVVDLSDILQWTLRQSADMENTMTSVERNMEYTKLEQEPPTVAEGGAKPPQGWPDTGQIDYECVTASYRPGLDPVLKNLSFSIPGGSSVGIVGRTGSGKSSLLLTLFRLIDIREGTIKIDGLDVASIGVDALRKQLAVIPQDPVLFSGTLRSNLDPWNQQSDAKVWAVLRQVCLDSAVEEVGGLDAPIAECGSNLSVGQRQLLCLARALLSDAKILALDEATANVDSVTDGLIQSALRSVISEKRKTLLVIAHRIETVLGCDLVLVLENGEVVEFGNTAELLDRPNGVFAPMVLSAGRTVLE